MAMAITHHGLTQATSLPARQQLAYSGAQQKSWLGRVEEHPYELSNHSANRLRGHAGGGRGGRASQYVGHFRLNQRFTLTGALTKVDWRNPHIELFVDVKTEQGQVQTWRYEGPSPGIFRTRNIGKDNFTIGMTLKVEASRARDGSMWGLMREVTLPDGTVVSLCPQNC